MIFTIYTDYEWYKSIVVNDLVSPYSDNTEPVQLELYKKITSTFASSQVAKTPTAIFMGANGEIPKKDWTPRMRAFVKEQSQLNPPPDQGTKWTWSGRILITLGAFAFFGIIAWFSFFFLFKKDSFDNAKAEFIDVPEIGDKYFGRFVKLYTIGTDTTAFHQYIEAGEKDKYWVLIKSVDRSNAKAILQIGNEKSSNRFEPKTVNSDNFDHREIPVTYEIDTLKYDVTFKNSELNFAFESTVFSNEYHLYKIPVRTAK